MELGKRFKTIHTGSEELKVVKIYNKKQFVVKVGNTEKKILASQDEYSEPQLSLAHVSKSDTLMTPIQKERLWND